MIFSHSTFLWKECSSFVFNFNPKSSFVCQTCGPRPKTLFWEGVAIGMLWEKIGDIPDLVIPFNSVTILDDPSYKDRILKK